MKRALVLAEGKTEEAFVKQVLWEHFWGLGLHLEPTILTTKIVKAGRDFRGGLTTFGKFKNDILRLFRSRGDALVTTMIDYYRLPPDFPGVATLPTGSALERVEWIEKSVLLHFDAPPWFVPYLSLHEFEALLFASPEQFASTLPARHRVDELARIRAEFSSPEEINERPGLSPSKRIMTLFPSYQKALHGPIGAQRIGLARLRAECAHFNSWIAKLEHFASGVGPGGVSLPESAL
jgi:hypothetical protein